LQFAFIEKYGRPLGSRPRIWGQSWIPWSQSAVSFLRMDVALGKGWVCRGRPVSSVRTGMSVEMEVAIGFPAQISGPPVGWRSAMSKVAILRAMMDLHAGVWSLSL
jgi:hypothetical protein